MEFLYQISSSFFAFLFVVLLWAGIQIGPVAIVYGLTVAIYDAECLEMPTRAKIILGVVCLIVFILMLPYGVATWKYVWNDFFGEKARERSIPVEVVKTEVRRYKLLDMNPPKHFYVDIEDVETHQVYERRYVSKHCNNWRDNKLGDSYNIQVVTKKQGDRTWMEFQGMYGVFC